MPMMWYGYSWGSALIMLLNMVFWAAIIGLLVWALVRWLTLRSPGAGAPGPSALEILRQRYARGDIDAATFEQMRARLEDSAPTREPTAVS
jgi:putative membrane protein